MCWLINVSSQYNISTIQKQSGSLMVNGFVQETMFKLQLTPVPQYPSHTLVWWANSRQFSVYIPTLWTAIWRSVNVVGKVVILHCKFEHEVLCFLCRHHLHERVCSSFWNQLGDHVNEIVLSTAGASETLTDLTQSVGCIDTTKLWENCNKTNDSWASVSRHTRHISFQSSVKADMNEYIPVRVTNIQIKLLS